MDRQFLMVALLCSAVGVASCGKGGDKAAESAMEKRIREETGGEVSADLDKGRMTLKTQEGEVTISEEGKAKIPEGFPTDVLVYKGASVMMSSRQGDGFMVNLATSDDADKVVAAYKESMSKKGWKEDSMMDLGGQKTLVYKKDKQTAAIMIGSEDGQTVIHITAEIPKE